MNCQLDVTQLACQSLPKNVLAGWVVFSVCCLGWVVVCSVCCLGWVVVGSVCCLGWVVVFPVCCLGFCTGREKAECSLTFRFPQLTEEMAQQVKSWP